MNNIYIYAPLVIWFVAQLAKFVINLIRGRADVRYFVAAGGMPSAHAAVVCSLAAITYFEAGANSAFFGFAIILAAIVMYDSFGVRRSAGEQAKMLNRLTSDLSASGSLRNSDDYGRVREILGHKPLEVFIGALLGVIGAVLFEWSKVSDKLKFLLEPFNKNELMLLSLGLVAILLAMLVYRWWQWQAYGRDKKQTKRANSTLRWGILALVWSAFLIFANYQQVPYFETRLAIGVSGLVITPLLLYRYKTDFVAAQAEKRSKNESARRDKWLKKTKRK